MARSEHERRQIVVTGGSSGIGLALVELLLGDGAQVVVVDKARCPLSGVHAIHLDLADLAAVEALPGELRGRRLSGIANVAGLPGTAGAAAVIATNVLAPIALTRVLLPQLSDGSSIVNVGSISSRSRGVSAETAAEMMALQDLPALHAWLGGRDLTGDQAYRLSKRAITEWTRQLSPRLLPRGIRVNCVSPGPVATPILEDFRTSMGAPLIDGAAAVVGRHAAPSEVAGVIRFLLGAESAWVNGTDVVVDGGLLAQWEAARHMHR